MIQEETIKTQYGNIAAYKKGAGSRNVLLLHGAGCDSTMLSWREVFNTFSDDYSVYAFDFLGYGNSDRADDLAGDSFFDTHIECVKTVVSYYGLRLCLSRIINGRSDCYRVCIALSRGC